MKKPVMNDCGKGVKAGSGGSRSSRRVEGQGERTHIAHDDRLEARVALNVRGLNRLELQGRERRVSSRRERERKTRVTARAHVGEGDDRAQAADGVAAEGPAAGVKCVRRCHETRST